MTSWDRHRGEQLQTILVFLFWYTTKPIVRLKISLEYVFLGWRLVFYISDLLNDALYRRRWKYFERTAFSSGIRRTECVRKAMQL